jgi:hypothetical protein
MVVVGTRLRFSFGQFTGYDWWYGSLSIFYGFYLGYSFPYSYVLDFGGLFFHCSYGCFFGGLYPSLRLICLQFLIHTADTLAVLLPLSYCRHFGGCIIILYGCYSCWLSVHWISFAAFFG